MNILFASVLMVAVALASDADDIDRFILNPPPQIGTNNPSNAMMKATEPNFEARSKTYEACMKSYTNHLKCKEDSEAQSVNYDYKFK